MAINLASKYSKKVAEKFYTESVILGKTSREYDWDGVKSINVHTIVTQAPGNYTRTGASRYGTPSEVQDTMQTMEITQDKSVALTVDKGNNTQQNMIKNAGKVMALEVREQFVPMMDKYALDVWATNAGTTLTAGALTKANIVEKVAEGVTALVNAETTIDDAYCYIGASNFGKLIASPEFLGIDKLGEKALEKGVLGHVRGMKIVQVPDSYLPSGVNFIIAKASSVLAPTQIKDMKIHEDAPGISGALLEVRWLFDAFVLEARNKGVVVQKAA